MGTLLTDYLIELGGSLTPPHSLCVQLCSGRWASAGGREGGRERLGVYAGGDSMSATTCLLVRACVRACARACVRACARARVRLPV